MNPRKNETVVKIVGIGTAGVGIINKMIKDGISGVDFIAISINNQVLVDSKVEKKIYLGTDSAQHLGSGTDLEMETQTTIDSTHIIMDILRGSDLVFLLSGEESGVGTALITSQIAREMGFLIIGVILKEGNVRSLQMEEPIQEFRKNADTFIVLEKDEPSQKTSSTGKENEVCLKSDQILSTCVKGITRLLQQQSALEVNLRDVRKLLEDTDQTIIGIGRATGEEGAKNAAKNSISSAQMKTHLRSTTGVLVIITGSSEITFFEINDAVQIITECASESANIIFGYDIDDSMKNTVEITVVAAGLGSEVT